jgi:hypothetical protein
MYDLVPTESTGKSKKIRKKYLFFVGVLEVKCTDPGPYQNVTDPEYCYSQLTRVRSTGTSVFVSVPYPTDTAF